MRHSQNKYEDVQLMQGFFRQQWNFSLSKQITTVVTTHCLMFSLSLVLFQHMYLFAENPCMNDEFLSESHGSVQSSVHHLLLAEPGLGSSPALAEHPCPADPGEDLGGGKTRGDPCRLVIPRPLARQHVVRPAGRDAHPLDRPLERRHQQGDEPQKHQLCITHQPKKS